MDGGISLQKRFFDRLSVKVFFITFLIQILAGALICGALYLSTPETYLHRADDYYHEVFELVYELRHVSEKDGGVLIDEFIRNTGIEIAIYDANASSENGKVFADTSSRLSLKSEKAVAEQMKVLSDRDEYGTFEFFYDEDRTLRQDGENPRYELAYFCSHTGQNILPRSIRKSLPMMLGVILVLSLICSYIYTVLFAKPVKKLSDVSRSMAEMDFSKKCGSKRKDEIGDLGRDLDAMAGALEEKIGTLHTKNQELQEEMTRRQELENQKDMFFSAASHELKTPVTVLEGQLRGMIEGVGPYVDHEEYLPRALGMVKRMESLINEILTASRMQSAQEITTSKTDMAQILEEKMEECEELFEARGITMDLSFEKDLFFTGNRDLTSLALGSFMSNAAFYSKDGAKVEVCGEHGLSGEKKVIRVTIRNSDAHIGEEDITHLFEPFYRTDKSRSRRSGGSGLGLYLAKLILEKQGGTCRIENAGEDVLATIELPCAH